MALVEIRNLHLAMRTHDGEIPVLRGINLELERGRITGVVGETGSGKSLTGLSISKLVPTPPGRYLSGSILYNGQDLMQADEGAMQALRGREIGMIFQDPTTNLNPSFRIATQMIDIALSAASKDPAILGLGSMASRRERRIAARARAVEMLGRVGIPEPAERIDAYPHQFSGGMRQRVLIAMALLGRPRLLIADEPTTALDVSVQAQVLRVIYDLVRERDLAVMFITHNLGVVAQICDDVAVLRTGEVVESGPVSTVLKSPNHAYTKALLVSVPTRAMRRGDLRVAFEGEGAAE